MDYNGLNEIIQRIYDNDNILIPIHDKPDGDAVGSSTALALFLKKLGKNCAVISPSAIPNRLAFAKNENVKYIEGVEKIDFSYDYIITVDVASPELIGAVIAKLDKPISTVIDHHRVNTIDAEFKYVDETAAAAGEIIFSLISMYCMVTCAEIFDTEICEALYTSISSDTGCFKYGNTTAESYKIASQLMSVGINAEEINRLLFDTKSFKQLKTEQLGIDKLELYCDGKLAVTCIDIADLEAIGASEEDTETISQLARTVAGVQIGVMMREKVFHDGKTGYKFSVRANSDTDVSALCAAFGGGGHKKAAGCTIYEDKKTALDMFIKESEKYII